MLEVLGEMAVAVQPCKGAFDNQSAGQDNEALGVIGTLDDLKRPVADFGERLFQLLSRIAAICEHMAQPREAVTNVFYHHWRAVPVLNVGAVDDGVNQKAVGVGDDMALSAFGLYPSGGPRLASRVSARS